MAIRSATLRPLRFRGVDAYADIERVPVTPPVVGVRFSGVTVIGSPSMSRMLPMSVRRIAFCLGMLAGVWLGGPLPMVDAVEVNREFLQGLRDRQYFDMAVYYLDQLAQRSDLAPPDRELIPYEKALTLLESSRATRSPERQIEQLDQALAFLEQFTKDSPNHALSADANSERAQILIGKAKVETLQSKAPANQGAKADYQNRARQYIAQARQVFQTAYQQHETSWKSYGTYINRDEEPQKFEARAKAEVNMIRAQLDLALCTYEEAQTHDIGAAPFKEMLEKAATQFEEMHQRYRSQVGGLYARLWQGKCYEENGDLQKAFGIYNELLGHPGTEGPITRLKDQTLHFKLILLNTPARSDHQLVVDMGEEWLKTNKVESRSRTGLGIRWEVARAYESLGDNRELAAADAQRLWRSARDSAGQVNRYPGEYKDVSLALMQRLDVKIGGKERKPDTFDAAFGLGRQQITAIRETKDKIDGAKQAGQPAEEVKKLQQDLANQLAEAAENFDLALRLVTPQDDAKSVTMARYMYAYVNFLQRRNYEAAILGEYVAKTVDKEDATTGLQAAYLSMAAYVQAFNDTKGSPSDKSPDLNFIIKACNLLSDRWPDSDSANEARITLGQIYTQLKQPVEAAAWFNKVPETDAKYLEAQLAAGQAYWTAYLTVGRGADEANPPTTEQLTQWRQQAEQLLTNGIAKLSATVPKEGAAPAELIAAKMSLAQIVISLGKDAEAITLLIGEPQSVIKAIAVADEAQRPEKGVQSRQFATETYKLLLRAYIGNGKLNEARDTMKTLEKVAGAAGGADVTELYVGLGKLLREELDRFRQAGETERFNSLMTSFETFLNDLYTRQEGQTFGSLSWIGETYFALGEAAEGDATRSTAAFEKAGKAFEEILTRAETQPEFLPADQVPAVKVRLVRCYRLRKDFENGLKLLGEVLKVREKDLRAQAEGASLYQAWGATGDLDKYLMAINGNPDVLLWGWRNLGQRLQNAVDSGRKELMGSLMEARLQGSRSRQQYALAQTSLEKRTAELEKAEIELIATVSVTKDIPEEHFAALNKLYHEILKESGKPIVNLEPAEDVPEAVAEAPAAKPKKKTKAKAPGPPPAAAISSTTTLIALGVTVVAGMAVVGWMLAARGRRKAPLPLQRADDKVAFTGVTAAPMTTDGPPASKPKPRPTAAAPSGTTKPATTGTAMAVKPTAKPAGPTAAPKPKPKPPAS
jgi:tetratricopeptide (TPR) repeat protein